MKFFRFASTIAMLAGIVVSGCKESTTQNTGTTTYGTAAALGSGTVKSVVVTDKDNKPTSIGVVLSDSVLATLPAVTQDITLALPASGVTPFTHIFFNWNPVGHDPTPIYGLPHFDMHFYIIPETERIAIIPGPDTVPVSATYIAPNYFTPPPATSVPGMGVHYVDTTSSEFLGAAFTKTLIYGYYHGSLVFIEPMISKAYLDTKPNSTGNTIKQPSAFQKSGYYPTQYTVKYDSVKKEYWITLDYLANH